ncbi:MAG: class I SAM-dependent methyltransferase [Bacteroidota bacterium]|nr:class I SAM-dependent methyltransferase [Bacteroidota bacterium]
MGNRLSRYLFTKTFNRAFPGSAGYWEKRYLTNGNSGAGSYGEKALYKASVLNRFVAKKKIQNIIEFGCGDGNQLSYFRFPSYTGLDVSPTAIKKCRGLFKEDLSKRFFVCDQKTLPEDGQLFFGELALSLDVIYHLVEDEVFESYMSGLFNAATKYVIIYAWDVDEEKKYHVRHRRFSKWIEQHVLNFRLSEQISNQPFCDFFVYERVE